MLIKKYEFQVREEVYETTGKGGKLIKTKKKVAVLVIQDVYRHVKNEAIDWLVLKEAQEIVVDVNQSEEINSCFKQREHRRLKRQSKKVDMQNPSIRGICGL